MEQISGIPHLETLILAGCKAISNLGFLKVSKIRSLQTLSLRKTNADDAAVKFVGALANLTYLDLVRTPPMKLSSVRSHFLLHSPERLRPNSRR